MRVPRVRSTVRRMMVAVAVVAVLLGCLAQIRTWETERLRRGVASHAQAVKLNNYLEAFLLQKAAAASEKDRRMIAIWKDEATRHAKAAAYHEQMKKRFLRRLR